MMKQWAITLALSAVFGAGAVVWASTPDAGMETSAQPAIGQTAPAVRVVKAQPAQAMQTRRFFGQVRARESADLSFEVGGTLNLLDAIEGDRIMRGKLLARLDPAPFERAVERATATLDQARREHDRAQTLVDSATISQARLEDVRTARDLSDIALRDAQDALEDTKLVAPFDALVADRLTANFTLVEPGQPILRLHDMSEVRIEFDLPERLLAKVGNPEDVRFTTTLPDQDRPIALRFVEFRAETGSIGQSYVVTLAFPDVQSEFLVPGASVTVTAATPSDTSGMTLPASALLSDADRGTAVMILEEVENGRLTVRRQPVEVRSETGTGFRVSGLAEGAEVVAAGGHLLRTGQTVRRYTGLVVEER
jgi:RND family efflux transporter MFP subunit